MKWKVMKMKNKEELQKHIQLLNEIKSRYPILNDTIKYLEEYKQSLSNPTLLECIKEWNENGFDVDIYALEIIIANYSTAKCEADEVEFSIDLLSKQVSIPNGCWAKLPFKIYHLLSKTLKALEEIKDECN